MKVVKTSFAVEYKFRLGLSTSGRTLNRKESGMILESLLPKCIACVCVCVYYVAHSSRGLFYYLFYYYYFLFCHVSHPPGGVIVRQVAMATQSSDVRTLCNVKQSTREQKRGNKKRKKERTKRTRSLFSTHKLFPRSATIILPTLNPDVAEAVPLD